MLKRIFLSIAVLLVAAYLVVALTAFNRLPEGMTCLNMDLIITDTVYAGFITKEEVLSILEKHDLNPIGQKMEEVSSKAIEDILSQHHLIDEAECYKTPSGKLCVEVTQRIPILRVMSGKGENYYVDNKGTMMPNDAKCVAHLAVATGNIEKSFATRDLYKFALFLQRNRFWEAQVEQINILPDKTVELVPRVGSHIIYLGSLDGYEQKLKRVKEFYEKALNRVGWNKYSRINVEFGNQIICTKNPDLHHPKNR